MKLDAVVVIHVYYNFTKFHPNQMKNKKVLSIAHFSVQNFTVSVELWKLYIVGQQTTRATTFTLIPLIDPNMPLIVIISIIIPTYILQKNHLSD